MSDVAHEGRAILFVSHNLEAVQRLCDRCIWIDGGKIRDEGDPDTVVRAYLENGEELRASYLAEPRPATDQPIGLREATILNAHDEPAGAICFGEPFSVRLSWDVAREFPGATFVVHVRDVKERLVFVASTHGSDFGLKAGTTMTTCSVRENVLLPGDYSVTVSCVRPPRTVVHHVDRCLRLRVLDVAVRGRTLPLLRREALVAPDIRWDVQARASTDSSALGAA